jgi:hypothetical protein
MENQLFALLKIVIILLNAVSLKLNKREREVDKNEQGGMGDVIVEPAYTRESPRGLDI